MKSSVNNLYSIFKYGVLSVFTIFMAFSVFISLKTDVVEEHVEFLNAQIPRLKSENIGMYFELRKASKLHKSLQIEIDKYQPFIDYMIERQNDFSLDKLELINNHLMYQYDMHDIIDKSEHELFDKSRFENLSKNYQSELAQYFHLDFLNKLLQYLLSKFGTYNGYIMENQFSIVDFWSKGEYHIHLNYLPKTNIETSMKINNVIRNENALLFGPKHPGLHTIDIALSQFDSKGNEQKLNFKKEIMVYP